jgi:hypothetical protein
MADSAAYLSAIAVLIGTIVGDVTPGSLSAIRIETNHTVDLLRAYTHECRADLQATRDL